LLWRQQESVVREICMLRSMRGTKGNLGLYSTG